MSSTAHVRHNEEPITARSNVALDWLFNAAAPLWSSRGWHDKGMFAERLSLAGEPDAAPRRIFVQARHVYSFCHIGRLGWTGPWQEKANATVNYLLANGRRDDGFFIHSFTADGLIHDARADLYNQAFMMFCMGHAGQLLARPELFAVAEEIAQNLEKNWRKRGGGFYEGEMVDQAIRLQNPHMHLLEAFIALFQATGDERWKARADEIVALCVQKFISPESGALTEYFDDDFRPLAGDQGRLVEPGHCCEWAWLFESMGGQADPTSERLVSFARTHGIDAQRGVMVNEVLLSGVIKNATARLWPQTERLKAALSRARRINRKAELAEAVDAFDGLSLYLDTPTPGTWRDKLHADGSWQAEPAPGSSLYHITCSFVELVHTQRQLAIAAEA